jgi:peroxiredoxin
MKLLGKRLGGANGRLCPVGAAAASAREYLLIKSRLVIGSEEGSDILVRDISVSRRHAQLSYRLGRHTITDLGSTNGTFVNNQRVTRPTLVVAGDELKLGTVSFILANPPARMARRGFGFSTSRAAVVTTAVLAFAAGFGLSHLLQRAGAPGQPASPMNSTQGAPSSASSKAQTASINPPASALPSAQGSPEPAIMPAGKPGKSPLSGLEGLVGDKLGAVAGLASLVPGSGRMAGHQAPPFSLAKLSGGSTSLAALQGKTVLLNLWSIQCADCRKEMPTLEKLSKLMRDHPDFQILAVDQKDSPAAVAAFVKQQGYDFPVALDPQGQLSASYGNGAALPSSFIISPKGVIWWDFQGALDWSNPLMQMALKRFL